MDSSVSERFVVRATNDAPGRVFKLAKATDRCRIRAELAQLSATICRYKLPNIFFASVMVEDKAVQDKAVEGFVMPDLSGDSRDPESIMCAQASNDLSIRLEEGAEVLIGGDNAC